MIAGYIDHHHQQQPTSNHHLKCLELDFGPRCLGSDFGPRVEPFEWVLKNIALDTGFRFTFFGVNLGPTFVSSCKTETDIWNDIRCQKDQALVDLVLNYKIGLLALGRSPSAYEPWVVFDRHHNNKHNEYVAKQVPCNILVMSSNGDAAGIKGSSTTSESNDESPIMFSTFTIPAPKFMLSDECKRKLQITCP
ncbi:hypothetical protein L1987_02816 [Smallanthus sonchifolius]|uniref:Uncharacterized protein n=1 Tax=Smallanthus sonchifolius TaxID=185202 RepID=A0ACB9K8T8_9ASTR|nr:hypothetical protein L1987_02816 [Smallanthus sonchifolius]